MADETKAFYLVTGMSEAFRKFDDGVMKAEIPAKQIQAVDMTMKLWNLRIQMAQAQQLTMISESLKTISETLKMVLKVSSSAAPKS